MKQYHRYQMNFEGKAFWLSCIFMGIPILLLSVYFLFLKDISEITGGVKFLYLWAPLLLCCVYLLLLWVIHWNAPGVYAILGALFSILLIAQLFANGDLLRSILGMVGYLVCGGLLILSAGGWLPGRLPAALCYGFMLLMRLLCYGFGRVSGSQWLVEVSILSILAGLMFLPIAMIPGKMKELS